ncbi:MAG: hypothetical protein PHO37_01620 [Kiritimatiellae bacterium]|nr:hypothetical protein [Kiritimatiellia bacterium]
MKAFYTTAAVSLFVCGVGLAEPQRGLIADFPIDTKLFPATKEYYKSKVPRKVFKAYDDGNVPASWKEAKTPVDECIEYNPAEHTTLIYVPESYSETGNFGVYLHNSPGERGITPAADWKAIMDKFKLIYISPHKASNNTPHMRRLVLAMDSLATVRKHFKINDQRVYVGGLSGGGHMGMMCQMVYPEQFNGAISHAAQSYLPDRGCGHFPGLTLADAKSAPRKKLKWCVVSGDKDFNYKAILETSKEWDNAGFMYKFFDHKGMGHANASGPALEEALIWIGADELSESAGNSEAVTPKSFGLRTWSAVNGKTIDATLVEDKGVRVVLKTEAGQELSIYTAQLSAADRKYLADLKQ